MIVLESLNGFSVAEVAKLTEETKESYPSTFKLTADAYSDDGKFVYTKGTFSDCLHFTTYADMVEYIYQNGWTKPEPVEEDI